MSLLYLSPSVGREYVKQNRISPPAPSPLYTSLTLVYFRITVYKQGLLLEYDGDWIRTREPSYSNDVYFKRILIFIQLYSYFYFFQNYQNGHCWDNIDPKGRSITT